MSDTPVPPTQNRYFGFLDRTINILLVDDTPEVLEYLVTVFSQVGTYKVHTARNARTASTILRSDTRIHLVTLDLGISDINNDEFGLIKKFGARIPFVVITGQNDTEKGGQCILHGAKGVLHKPMDLAELLPKINSHALQSILAPRRHMDPDTLFCRSLTHLFKHQPETITEWAKGLKVTAAGLWRTWDEVQAIAVKQVLLVYQLYSAGFKYYENRLLNTEDDTLPVPKREYKRLEKRFRFCQNELNLLLK